MNIAAYCRVSTEKEDQLNSMVAQKRFFAEYTARTGDKLVRLYADEGLSGTKMKNRKEFLQMMSDAKTGVFEAVVVKDISRFARNTVDLLQNIRQLKSLGIAVHFLTANMTNMGDSEFVLTLFGAMAQEESANTSKRVKFGKKLNAQKGKVPNFVFGYEKTRGDYFTLKINRAEADTVRQIFDLYARGGYGAGKIATLLNEKGIMTKRGCRWTQTTVCRILTNELYTGVIINGKEEVADFLTGRREKKPREEWTSVFRKELAIIDREIFEKTGRMLSERSALYKSEGRKESGKHLFSTLLCCKECGWSFCRNVRTYQNTYIRWVCSGRNRKGTDSCPNAVSIPERELMGALEDYYIACMKEIKNVTDLLQKEMIRLFLPDRQNKEEGKRNLERLKRAREKYMELYTEDLITKEELEGKLQKCRQEIAKQEKQLDGMAEDSIARRIAAEFCGIQDFVDLECWNNAMLKSVVERVTVDRLGNVEIVIRNL